MIKSNQPICISQRSNDRLNINKKKFKISKANRILLKISILSWINRQISQETFPLSLFIAMPNGNRRSKSFFSRDKSGRPLSQINATWIFAVSVNRFLFSFFFFPRCWKKKKKDLFHHLYHHSSRNNGIRRVYQVASLSQHKFYHIEIQYTIKLIINHDIEIRFHRTINSSFYFNN